MVMNVRGVSFIISISFEFLENYEDYSLLMSVEEYLFPNDSCLIYLEIQYP